MAVMAAVSTYLGCSRLRCCCCSSGVPVWSTNGGFFAGSARAGRWGWRGALHRWLTPQSGLIWSWGPYGSPTDRRWECAVICCSLLAERRTQHPTDWLPFDAELMLSLASAAEAAAALSMAMKLYSNCIRHQIEHALLISFQIIKTTAALAALFTCVIRWYT